ncbi:MAG: putative lipid II flippase FtsW [Acidobacteriota bacterium]
MAKKLAFDRALFTSIILLVVFGVLMVYSASSALAREEPTGVNPFVVKQLAAVMVGLVAMFVFMHLDYQRFRQRAVVYFALGAMVTLLVLVLFSPTLNNTNRWFFVGPVSIQPSELAKPAIILFLAYFLDAKADRLNQRPVLLILVAVVGLFSGLILMQPDFGTAALLMATAGVMLFVAGLSWRYVITAGLISVPALALAIYLEPYRMQRLISSLNWQGDPFGAGYQVRQSLIAVGSGGFSGLGLGESLQKLYFLPYPHTDFIFAIICEELGMIGALFTLALYGLLLWRGLTAARRAPDRFGELLALGFIALLGIQALIHMSVSLALLPTKGIPLPFVSSGGSSLVASLAACGVLLNISQHS